MYVGRKIRVFLCDIFGIGREDDFNSAFGPPESNLLCSVFALDENATDDNKTTSVGESGDFTVYT